MRSTSLEYVASQTTSNEPVTIATNDVTDGIQYVAYSGQSQTEDTSEATPTIIRRSSRKRGVVTEEDSKVKRTRT